MEGSEGRAPEAALGSLRAVHERDGALPLAERRRLLQRLAGELVQRAERLVTALDADFGRRSAAETLLAELLCVVEAARHAHRHLQRWARPRRVFPGLPFWPAAARIVPQAKGVVGIIAPWNYPVQLALSPLVGALAAGNRILVKTSELTPRTAAELEALLETALGGEVAQTVQGGPAIAARFSRLPLDHLLFTGSTVLGREVMRAAADRLVPLTLELGGKCPAVLLPDADLDAAARSLVSAKLLNAGQTCIAPDTALLVGGRREAFRQALAQATAELFPDGPPTALHPERQAARLVELTAGAALDRLAHQPGGEPALALAWRLPSGHALHREEIFGPVLPVVELPDLDAACAWIAGRPAALAVYLYSRDRAAEQRLLERTRSGALVVNGALLQVAIEALPFGGVGHSGFGRYHGQAGFETFSDLRAHVRAPRWSLARLTDPPHDARKRRIIERLLHWRARF